jgi:hypothetical protein
MKIQKRENGWINTSLSPADPLDSESQRARVAPAEAIRANSLVHVTSSLRCLGGFLLPSDQPPLAVCVNIYDFSIKVARRTAPLLECNHPQSPLA